MTPTHPSNARIAVIGAGPGGLTCARVLQQQGRDVVVHEGDTALDSRRQGGTLDMHADTGQIALAGAGLLGEFHALARPEGQHKRFVSPEGTTLVEHHPSEDEYAAPEIDRGQLRELLTTALRPGTVQWGNNVRTVSPNGDGTHRIRFADCGSDDVDLVIGADGAWSKVRPLVSDTEPTYSGVCFVEAHFADVDRAHPTIAELVGDGHVFASGDSKGLIGQRNSNGHVGVFIALRDQADWYRADHVDPHDTRAMRAALLERFRGWDERLLTLIRDNDGSYTNRPIHAIPAPHSWPSTPGVTLLGDAGHLRTPFGGNGANLAMLEGYELAVALAEHDTCDEAVTAYERVMQPRNVAAGDGIATIQQVFAPGERDTSTVPDFDEEATRYHARAAEYPR